MFGRAATTIDNARLALCPFPSVAVTVKLAVPAPVGVPEIAPLDELSDKPPGNEPTLTDHVNDPDPPEAANVALYPTPTSPPGNDDVDTDGCDATTIDNACAS